jgi:hypothetical protein
MDGNGDGNRGRRPDVAITGCLFAVLGVLRPSTPRTPEVLRTTDTMLRTVSLAEQIGAEGARHHLNIVLTAKEDGTLATLAEVDSPSEIKCALVIGGATARDYPQVRAVTSVAKEHLHLPVKRDLADKGISALRGKRFGLGPPHDTARTDIRSDERACSFVFSCPCYLWLEDRRPCQRPVMSSAASRTG